MTSVDSSGSMEELVGRATLRIDAIAADKSKSEDAGAAKLDFGREQYLNIHVQMSLPQSEICDKDETVTHLVLVVDKSGSMAGKPWQQVQESLKDLIGRSIGLSGVKTDLIVYDDKANHVKFQPDNYVQVIDGIKASSTTNFKKAFEKITTVVQNDDASVSKIVVVFMTDGNDTCNLSGTIPPLIKTLATSFTSLHKEVCVHTVGFSTGHNFDLLKKLAESGGTTPGMFRYCEPGENTVSLQQKLDELFDFLLHNSNQPAYIHISMLGANSYFITGGQQKQTVVLDGTTVQEQGDIQVTGEAWVHIDDFENLHMFQVVVETKIAQKKPQESQSVLHRIGEYFWPQIKEIKNVIVPCISEEPELRIIESVDEKAAWNLRILTRNVEDLVTRTATAIANKEDVSHFQEKVEKYQQKIAHTRVFGNGITKEGRETMFTTIKETQASLDRIQSMLAEYLRTGTGSISLLARAHDMRYQAVFSKSRRQRVMDKRVSKNMKHAQDSENNLVSLQVDEQEVKGLSQDALDFYFCVLSQDTVKDVLLGDDKADTIGFGLAVKRSEVVLDEPTLIRLQVISGTLVSRTAMLDALEYKINVSSQLTAHGGFNFKHAPLGVTTVGTGREPINAWLPLYITKSHWNRVKVILKPALGSFCTLDPLGYHYKQLDVLFAVLGSMVGQLTDKNVGEHRLRLLFAVQRTCAACLEDFDLLDTVKETVRNFLTSPEGRTKDIIANLHTLIGYIVAMPTATAQEIFGIEGETNKLSGFWLGLISELVRRAAGGLYHNAETGVINGLLNALLNGHGSHTDKDRVPYCQAVSQLIALCGDPGMSNLDLNIQPFDPSTEVKIPTPVMKHDPKIDKAMEIWAQGKTGYLKNLVKNKKYKVATKVVQKWLKEISTVSDDEANKAEEVDCLGDFSDIDTVDDDMDEEEVDVHDEDDDHKPDDGAERVAAEDKEVGNEGGAESGKDNREAETDTDGNQFDSQDVSSYMLKVIAQLHNKICQATFPGIQSLPGCIAFVNNWLSRQHDIHDLDTNSGLPPQEWINEVRTAVTDMYRQLNDYEKAKIAESLESTDDGEEECTSFVIVEAGTQQEQEQGNSVTVEGVPATEEVPVQQKGNNNPENDVDDDAAASNNDVDYDDDSYDDYSDDGFDVDDDSYTENSRIQEERKKKKQAKDNPQFTLPTILQCIEKDQDTLLLLRSVLCQAVRFHTNSSARAAITNKTLLDLKDGEEARASTLCGFAKFLEELKVKLVASLLDKVIWQQANYCMLHATTPWAFVGYLMNIHKSRLEGFSELVDVLLNTTTEGQAPPCLQDKVHILLTGKYQELPVLDNGNQWLPEKKMATKFKTLLGPEIWMEFEVELRSSVKIHVYRESDIPNRHGHCNSNPYIPNFLRVKLGMKMLPKGKNPNKRRRIKR